MRGLIFKFQVTTLNIRTDSSDFTLIAVDDETCTLSNLGDTFIYTNRKECAENDFTFCWAWPIEIAHKRRL